MLQLNADGTSAKVTDIVRVEGQLVFGGPTVGKTTWVARLLGRGVPVIDSDLITDQVCPEWRGKDRWRTASKEEMRLVFSALGRAVVSDMAVSRDTTFLVNHWSPDFLLPLTTAIKGKVEVAFFRSNGEEIARLGASRGTKGFTPELTNKWVESFKASAFKHFERVYLLENGDYLADVLCLKLKPATFPVVTLG